MKDVEKRHNKFKKTYIFPWIGRININKMSHITQRNVQIHCDSNQIFKNTLPRTKNIQFESSYEYTKILNSQSNLTQQKQSWRFHNTWISGDTTRLS